MWLSDLTQAGFYTVTEQQGQAERKNENGILLSQDDLSRRRCGEFQLMRFHQEDADSKAHAL